MHFKDRKTYIKCKISTGEELIKLEWKPIKQPIKLIQGFIRTRN